jgi:uncharacterized membrane protein YecN with MAPEG domain
MLIPITGLYTGILGLILLFLSMQVSKERLKQKCPIGENGSATLLEAIRRHGNFVEWVPFTLILMAICESNSLASGYLHSVGVLLVLARLMHPLGIKHNEMPPNPLKAIGAGITFLLVFVLSITVIWQWFVDWFF